ncbi:SUF system NifU family Fe-S cluster assembly protein [Aerococcaceae bacterium DSM 111020]|nr:SUF system NifU family Fe-S cluster assembly protein [Aerococcaceae bacterium DSM 111020]
MAFENKLNYLYQEVIFDHTKYPRHQKKLTHPSHEMQLLNPSCGDVIIVQLLIEDNIIQDIGFTGEGCSISMASASMMTEVLIGETLEKAEAIVNGFVEFVGGPEQTNSFAIPEDELQELLQDAALLEGVKQFPARYKCATLAWKAAELGWHPDEQERLIDGLTIANE